MRIPRLYLETSVWNFYFAGDAPEKRKATKLFFNEVEIGNFEIFISEAVRAEIALAPVEMQKRLDELIDKYRPVELEFDEEVPLLVEAYISNSVLSARHYFDLLHLAYATINGMNVLVSWNLKHLVKMKTLTLGNNVNRANGYHEIMIFTPQAVIENED